MMETSPKGRRKNYSLVVGDVLTSLILRPRTKYGVG